MLKELSFYRELSGFNEARSHIDSKLSCFITAYRRNIEDLLGDIIKSGLSHIKITCGSGKHVAAFTVINNRFQENDFLCLMLSWCGKYGQKMMLMSVPKEDMQGKYYDSGGAIIRETEEITFNDMFNCFKTNIGKSFTPFSSIYVETEGRNYRGAIGGRYLAGAEFWRKYHEELELPWREESGMPRE